MVFYFLETKCYARSRSFLIIKVHYIYIYAKIINSWCENYIITDDLQMGGAFDWQMMSTPSSIVPRALTTKFKLHTLGRSLNMFEVRVEFRGKTLLENKKLLKIATG